MRFLLITFLACFQATGPLLSQPNRKGVPIVSNYDDSHILIGTSFSDLYLYDPQSGSIEKNFANAEKQSGQGGMDSSKDGMDLAIVTLDLKSREFQYSGAYNPLYLVRKLKRSEKTKLNKGLDLELPRGAIHDDKHLLFQISSADRQRNSSCRKILKNLSWESNLFR